MLTNIIFRSCILVALTTLFACEPDDSVVPMTVNEALLTTNETSSYAQPQEAGIPVPPNPGLPVDILPEYCTRDGATLWAVNPNKPGSPPYSQAIYTVTWYRDGEPIGIGAHLLDCVCGERVRVKVELTGTGEKGSAFFVPQPCQEDVEVDKK